MKYDGSCHCGNVKYSVELELGAVISCNCSMCGRSGTLLSFVPEAAFTLHQGESDLRDYQFKNHVIHHVFCTTCGIKPFARGLDPQGNKMVAINARCLAGVDVSKLAIHHYDGASV